MAIVCDASVPSLAQILTAAAKDEAILALGIGNEIELFQDWLDRVSYFLADAERRRFENRTIDRWMKQLRDVVYDAEDFVDQCYIRSQSSSPRTCYFPLSCFSKYGFRNHCGAKIKSIIRRLDSVMKDISALNLVSNPRDRRKLSFIIGGGAKKSLLVKFDIVGKRIGDDTKILVDLLLSKQHKVSVFAIVGVGGIDKTTLAQKIYNDEKLRANFCQVSPIWVCVSQDLSESDLLRTVIIRAGGDPGDAKEKKDLERILSATVKGKKFFLVLDGLRDDRVWEDLLGKPLESGLDESRILVTTRHESVAKRIGAVHFHQVERMSSEDGWLLLCSMTFLDDSNARVLQSVGTSIVEKCDGLPLALKAIAGVLRTKGRSRRDWEEVLENSAWSLTELPEGVSAALLLSYMELPPHLKQCFLYFALFPNDAELLRNRFVHLWIAEGFVEATGSWLLEEVAEGYWKELVQRSLLQPDPN